MFTGIITHLGKIEKRTSSKLQIRTDKEFVKKLTKGTSVAVNGICLTVVAKDTNTFSVEFIPETENKTNINYLKLSTEVNLELPATADTLFSGHIVQGHVDSVGKIKSIDKKGNSLIFTFAIPQSLSKYLVKKGTVSVNGISLTVIHVLKNEFTVGIIPHTWEHTMLHAAKVGEYVNLEVDPLAKYVEKLAKAK